NHDLEKLVAAGRFRGDLYYRLSVFTIRLPPLRERGSDLTMLVDHFLKRFNRELDREVVRVAPETLDILHRHPWPGNLRELQSVLKQALLRATGPVLVPDFLPSYLLAQEKTVPAAETKDLARFVRERLQAGSTDVYAEWLAVVERDLLTEVLR